MMRKLRQPILCTLLLCGLMLSTSAAPGRRQSPKATGVWEPARFEPAGRYLMGKSVYSIAIAGKYAYLGKPNGVLIVNLSQPDQPSRVGLFQTSSEVVDVKAAGQYIYVCLGNGNLMVVDVSKPSAPKLASVFPRPPGEFTYIWEVAIAEPYAYLAAQDAGLRVLDISDPKHPREVGFLDTISVYAVAWQGNIVYANAIQTIDVSDPSSPRLLGEYTPGVGRPVHSLRVQGEYAYLTWGSKTTRSAWGGVEVVKVSDPKHPILVGEENGEYGNDLVVWGDYLINLGEGIQNFANPEPYQILQMIDVADPTQPKVVGDLKELYAGWAYKMAMSGRYLYVVDSSNGGIRIYRFTPPVAARLYLPAIELDSK